MRLAIWKKLSNLSLKIDNNCNILIFYLKFLIRLLIMIRRELINFYIQEVS